MIIWLSFAILYPVLQIQIQDPGSGDFWPLDPDPWFGIRKKFFSRILNLGSRISDPTHELIKKCWVLNYLNSLSTDSSLFLYLWKKKFFFFYLKAQWPTFYLILWQWIYHLNYQLCENLWLQNKARQLVYFFPPLFCCWSGIRDPGW